MKLKIPSFFADAFAGAAAVGTFSSTSTETVTLAWDGLFAAGAGSATAVASSTGSIAPAAGAVTGAWASGGNTTFTSSAYQTVVFPGSVLDASQSYASSTNTFGLPLGFSGFPDSGAGADIA